MGIMSCAIVFLVGMSANAVFGYKDVQFDPRKRNSTLQTWGQEERKSVMERFNRATRGGVNPEGLGINHEEWIKSKAQKWSHDDDVDDESFLLGTLFSDVYWNTNIKRHRRIASIPFIIVEKI